MDTAQRHHRPTDIKCNNPETLCCTWDPNRCVTHRPARLAAWHRVIEGQRMPEWRRRSLEGRNRFDAVSDMTDRVAGR